MTTPHSFQLDRSWARTMGLSALATVLWASPVFAEASHIQCSITENGTAASGTATVYRDTTQVATGRCGAPIAVPTGTYRIVFRLDGAMDRPEQTRTVTVSAASANVHVDFQMAVLEIRMEAGGQRVAGLAVVSRNGQQIGSVGSGVAAHVSAGTYDIVVRYRAQEKRFEDVVLTPGQRRSLTASF